MLAAAAVTALAFGLKNSDDSRRHVDQSLEETRANQAWLPENLSMVQYQTYGFIQQPSAETAGRYPFNLSQPPYGIFKVTNGGKMENPDDVYRYEANAREPEGTM